VRRDVITLVAKQNLSILEPYAWSAQPMANRVLQVVHPKVSKPFRAPNVTAECIYSSAHSTARRTMNTSMAVILIAPFSMGRDNACQCWINCSG
jgi:hypothetical protein